MDRTGRATTVRIFQWAGSPEQELGPLNELEAVGWTAVTRHHYWDQLVLMEAPLEAGAAALTAADRSTIAA